MREQCTHVKITVRLDVDSANMPIPRHRRDGILSNFNSVMDRVINHFVVINTL